MMLGRLQMTTREALTKYNKVGTDVFGHPRTLPLKGIRVPRFEDKRMEEALQDVTQRDRIIAPQPEDDRTVKNKKNERKKILRNANKIRLQDANPDTART